MDMKARIKKMNKSYDDHFKVGDIVEVSEDWKQITSPKTGRTFLTGVICSNISNHTSISDVLEKIKI